MITEDDLRRALDVEALDARPLSPDERWADAPRPHQSCPTRSLLAGPAAAAAVAAAATLVTVVAGRGGGTAPEPPASGASTGFPLVYSYRLDDVPGYLATERDIYAGRQSVIFSVPTSSSAVSLDGGPATTVSGTQETARVDVYPAGAFDPAPARLGTPVTVNGRPGFFATVPVQLHDYVGESKTSVPAIVWQYAADSWAVAAGFDAPHQTQAVETALADAIVPGPNPVLLPAIFTNIPAGLVRDVLRVQTESAGSAPSAFTMGFRRPSTPPTVTDDDFVIAGNIMPTPQPASSDPAPQPSSTDPVPIGTTGTGPSAYAISTTHIGDGTTMYVNNAESRLAVSISWTDALSRTANLQWGQFEPASSMTDTSTWFDASVAIP